METFFCLIPSDRETYFHILREVAPRLDDAGVSFHVCRPGEDAAENIIKLHSKEVTK